MITFKIAVMELPVSYSMRDFMVTKCVGTYNRVQFMEIKNYNLIYCADGVWYCTDGC